MKAAKNKFSGEHDRVHQETHKVELCSFIFLNCVSVIQPRAVRRAGRVAGMEEFIWVDNSSEKSERALGRPRK
jgi:hypothetical protein